MKPVEIWVLERSAAGPARTHLQGLLSPEEHLRRDRFRLAADRDRFGLGRVLCRTVLGARLGRPPASIALEIQRSGRPVLANAPGGPWFSIAHSGELVVFALAPTPFVGVDVEHEDHAAQALDLAARICTPREQAALAACPVSERPRRFCAIWTLKEAYAKATGLGLQIDPARLGFDPDRAGFAEQLGDLSAADAAAWRFGLWRPIAGYSLALAFKPLAGVPLALGAPSSASTLFRA